MATTVQTSAAPAAQSSSLPIMCLLAGGLIPGAGHFLLRKPIRGVLLFLSIVGMYAIGIALQGKIFLPNTGDLIDILGFVSQIGAGLLYVLARVMDWGHLPVQTAMQDYGTKFIVVSGLLNLVAAVDAHSLANGRKAS